MISQQSANAIRDEVRDFYSYGMKSSNKAYVDVPRAVDYVAYDDPFELKWQTWTTRMMAAKAASRNVNALVSRASAPDRPKNTSLYSWGKSIYNGGERSIFAAGNCVEMAAVAAALAIDRHHVPGHAVYLASITRPGDHVFCVVSSKAPTWPNVMAMAPDAPVASGAFVIDPWLNTACPGEDYKWAAFTKIGEWSCDGKRIAWSGVNGNALGWWEPTGSYFDCFMHSELIFISATFDPSLTGAGGATG